MSNILSKTILSAVAVATCFTVGAASAQPSHQSSLQEATAIAEELAAQHVDPVRFAVERAESARVTLESRERGDGHDADVAFGAYAKRLAALVALPRPETLDALTAALYRPEPELQLIALTALREGASVGRERSEALLRARQLLLESESPVVRRQAFEAYSRWGNQDDVLSISQALGRSPGPVRDLAVREWLRIERERR